VLNPGAAPARAEILGFNGAMVAPTQGAGTVRGMTTFELPASQELNPGLQPWSEVPDDGIAPGAHLVLGMGKTMVVVRESNMFDLLAFATMIRQVLEPLVGRVAGVERVLELTGAAAEIMRNDAVGSELRTRLQARALYQGARPYGWVFEVEGTVFLFAMTSAFSDAVEDLRNDFTMDLIAEINRQRPAALVTGPSTRLVRRKDLGEKLGREAGLLRTRIYTKETPEGLDLHSTTGSTNWTLLCLLAEQDLRYTISRLLTGRIHHVRSGGWLAGEGALPLGFVLDGTEEKRPIVGDATQVRTARLLIELAAQAGRELDLPAEERTVDPDRIIAKLSAAGATKRSNKKANKQGEQVAGAALGTVTAPKTAVLSLLSVLSAYGADGLVTRMQGLPVTGLTRHDTHGHAIFKKDPSSKEEKGAIRFEWRFPKPLDEGGQPVSWASAEDLAAAQTYYEHLKATIQPGPSTTQTWPLVGLFTAADDYRLVYASRGYQWKMGGKVVGKFDAALTVTRFANAIIDTLDGLGLDPADVALTPSPSPAPAARPQVAELEERMAALQADFSSACAAVRDSREGSRQRDQHQDAADEIEAQLDRLEAEIAAASSDDVPTSEPDSLLVGNLATLLSILLDTAGEAVDPLVCQQLHRLVTAGTIEDCWDDATPWATFRATLAIPTLRGYPRHVDVSFEVGNTTQGPDRKAFWERRMPRVLGLRMTTDISIDELSERMGGQPSQMQVGRNLRTTLKPHFEHKGLPRVAAGAAATAIIDCPILSTRSIVWALLHDLPLPETIEDLDAAETSRHIEDLCDRYLSPRFDWSTAAWSSGGERLRREAVRWVSANTAGTDGASASDLTAALGLSSVSALTPLLWGGTRRGDGKARVLERTRPWPSGTFTNPRTGTRVASVPDSAKRVRLRSCPHCGHQGYHPVACVEFGDDPVLCPSCQRHPWDRSLKRPRSYLQLFEGPFGRTAADDRGRKTHGSRAGTVVGRPPTMPTPTRARRARRD